MQTANHCTRFSGLFQCNRESPGTPSLTRLAFFLGGGGGGGGEGELEGKGKGGKMAVLFFSFFLINNL